jgi:hypothetical protein
MSLFCYCYLSRTHHNIPPHSDQICWFAIYNNKEDTFQLGEDAWGANWTPQNFIFITTSTYNVIPKICVYRLLHDTQ